MIARVLRWFRRPASAWAPYAGAWHPTGIRTIFTGYDETRFARTFRREQQAAVRRRAKTARLIARQRQAEIVTFKARAK